MYMYRYGDTINELMTIPAIGFNIEKIVVIMDPITVIII
jgi:hypothetical protein